MISHEPHPLAGGNLAERQALIERSAAKRREKNRAAGIPDMEPERHQPVDWFAEVGYHSILDEIGRAMPDYDWSEEGGGDQSKAEYLEARNRDREGVYAKLMGSKAKPNATGDGAYFVGRKLKWPDRLPGLKTWAGNQTLAKLIAIRQEAMKGQTIDDLLTFEAPLSGASGLDGRVAAAKSSLDLGFSPDKTGVKSMTRVGLELLAIVGIETVPITVYLDGSFGYEAGGKRWRFRVGSRGQYYGRWETAEEDRERSPYCW